MVLTNGNCKTGLSNCNKETKMQCCDVSFVLIPVEHCHQQTIKQLHSANKTRTVTVRHNTGDPKVSTHTEMSCKMWLLNQGPFSLCHFRSWWMKIPEFVKPSDNMRSFVHIPVELNLFHSIFCFF